MNEIYQIDKITDIKNRILKTIEERTLQKQERRTQKQKLVE